ncbi:hypothetical protein TNIN_26181 [Trichonephila inaurata madagascariensis]|uniref:Uncharacterized protein n=1 Tax=Trichonephila inaurata madagascariensis TaxID=2747483 RepID=A0A8X7C6L0_9ARAC|nr:hypothetical protein TNIN_26181 [Trichonephila inaurata madagascariensis]
MPIYRILHCIRKFTGIDKSDVNSLPHIATCSECEDFIDTLEDIIDTLRKTDGVLEDVQKLRLVNEVQFVALKVSRKSIRLQNHEFKEYIEDIKKLNVQKFPTAPSPSKAKRRSRNKHATVSLTPGTVGKKLRAIEPSCSGNTTPTPTPTAHEDSEAMEGDSSSDESSLETKSTKNTTSIVAENGARDSAKGKGNLSDTEDEDFTLGKRKSLPSSLI